MKKQETIDRNRRTKQRKEKDMYRRSKTQEEAGAQKKRNKATTYGAGFYSKTFVFFCLLCESFLSFLQPCFVSNLTFCAIDFPLLFQLLFPNSSLLCKLFLFNGSLFGTQLLSEAFSLFLGLIRPPQWRPNVWQK